MLNIDVSDKSYLLTPPSFDRPPLQSTLPPIVKGYNLRQVGRLNLHPKPKPNVDPEFRMLDSTTTTGLRQTKHCMKTQYIEQNLNGDVILLEPSKYNKHEIELTNDNFKEHKTEQNC